MLHIQQHPWLAIRITRISHHKVLCSPQLDHSNDFLCHCFIVCWIILLQGGLLPEMPGFCTAEFAGAFLRKEKRGMGEAGAGGRMGRIWSLKHAGRCLQILVL